MKPSAHSDASNSEQTQEWPAYLAKKVGHDLKLPLTNIKLYTQMLEKLFDAQDDPKIKKYLEKIDKNADDLTDQISAVAAEIKKHYS